MYTDKTHTNTANNNSVFSKERKKKEKIETAKEILSDFRYCREKGSLINELIGKIVRKKCSKDDESNSWKKRRQKVC